MGLVARVRAVRVRARVRVRGVGGVVGWCMGRGEGYGGGRVDLRRFVGVWVEG